MKIWILYRDSAAHLRSEAHEVRRLVATAESRGHSVEVLAPEQFELVVTRDDRRSILVDGAPVELPDIVLPRMGAGTTYFALAVIRQLERLRVPTINTAAAIETVKDKLFAHQLLAQHHLPIPKTMLAKFPIDVGLVARALGFPVVVKTLSGSQGSGVFLCEDAGKFDDLMQLVRATQSNANLIFQEFVADSRGRDLRVFVVGGRVVAAMERRSAEGGFKANYTQGGEVRAWTPDRDAELLALESARVLGLEIAGIDLLFDGDGYKICEANSAPGFEGLEAATGQDIAGEIVDFLCFRMHGRTGKVPPQPLPAPPQPRPPTLMRGDGSEAVGAASPAV
ncbi:MAG: RimK family alpha-L-glutamate ligase [Pikeienuella sp.]